MSGQGFGAALEELKQGNRVSRANWNGPGQWLVLVPASVIRVEASRPLGKAAPELVGQEVRYRAHIDIKTVQGEIVPWIASQSDLLAEDWYVVEQ
jgi:hypothetical protein